MSDFVWQFLTEIRYSAVCKNNTCPMDENCSVKIRELQRYLPDLQAIIDRHMALKNSGSDHCQRLEKLTGLYEILVRPEQHRITMALLNKAESVLRVFQNHNNVVEERQESRPAAGSESLVSGAYQNENCRTMESGLPFTSQRLRTESILNNSRRKLMLAVEPLNEPTADHTPEIANHSEIRHYEATRPTSIVNPEGGSGNRIPVVGNFGTRPAVFKKKMMKETIPFFNNNKDNSVSEPRRYVNRMVLPLTPPPLPPPLPTALPMPFPTEPIATGSGVRPPPPIPTALPMPFPTEPIATGCGVPPPPKPPAFMVASSALIPYAYPNIPSLPRKMSTQPPLPLQPRPQQPPPPPSPSSTQPMVMPPPPSVALPSPSFMNQELVNQAAVPSSNYRPNLLETPSSSYDYLNRRQQRVALPTSRPTPRELVSNSFYQTNHSPKSSSCDQKNGGPKPTERLTPNKPAPTKFAVIGPKKGETPKSLSNSATIKNSAIASTASCRQFDPKAAAISLGRDRPSYSATSSTARREGERQAMQDRQRELVKEKAARLQLEITTPGAAIAAPPSPYAAISAPPLNNYRIPKNKTSDSVRKLGGCLQNRGHSAEPVQAKPKTQSEARASGSAEANGYVTAMSKAKQNVKRSSTNHTGVVAIYDPKGKHKELVKTPENYKIPKVVKDRNVSHKEKSPPTAPVRSKSDKSPERRLVSHSKVGEPKMIKGSDVPAGPAHRRGSHSNETEKSAKISDKRKSVGDYDSKTKKSTRRDSNDSTGKKPFEKETKEDKRRSSVEADKKRNESSRKRSWSVDDDTKEKENRGLVENSSNKKIKLQSKSKEPADKKSPVESHNRSRSTSKSDKHDVNQNEKKSSARVTTVDIWPGESSADQKLPTTKQSKSSAKKRRQSTSAEEGNAKALVAWSPDNAEVPPPDEPKRKSSNKKADKKQLQLAIIPEKSIVPVDEDNTSKVANTRERGKSPPVLVVNTRRRRFSELDNLLLDNSAFFETFPHSIRSCRSSRSATNAAYTLNLKKCSVQLSDFKRARDVGRNGSTETLRAIGAAEEEVAVWDNLNCRLSEEAAKEAINESGLVEPINTQGKCSCRLCGESLDVYSPNERFQHISHHTGGDQWKCNYNSCPGLYKTLADLNSHTDEDHSDDDPPYRDQMKPLEIPDNITVVEGYFCHACNFVQISKQRMDFHRQFGHGGVLNRIQAISLLKFETIGYSLDLGHSVDSDTSIYDLNKENLLFEAAPEELLCIEAPAPPQSVKIPVQHVLPVTNPVIFGESRTEKNVAQPLEHGRSSRRVENTIKEFILTKTEFYCGVTNRVEASQFRQVATKMAAFYASMNFLNRSHAAEKMKIIARCIVEACAAPEVAQASDLSNENLEPSVVKINNSYSRQDFFKVATSKKAPKCLTEMLEEHKLRDLYKCMDDTCSFTTGQRVQFQKHIKTVHENAAEPCDRRPWNVCAYCNQNFPNLTSHVTLTHKKSKFQCNQCFYRCHTQWNIITHQKNEHDNNQPNYIVCDDEKLPPKADIQCYICPCSIPFKKTETFIEHWIDAHYGEPLKCYFCPEVFHSIYWLVVHYRVHYKTKYFCKHCSYSTAVAHDIMDHASRVHPAVVFNMTSENLGLAMVGDDSSKGKNLAVFPPKAKLMICPPPQIASDLLVIDPDQLESGNRGVKKMLGQKIANKTQRMSNPITAALKEQNVCKKINNKVPTQNEPKNCQVVFEGTQQFDRVFGPDDIGSLPHGEIFATDIVCAVCLYRNKVRRNVVRHLESHKTQENVPSFAATNPVPISDIRMFDQGMNMADSSQIYANPDETVTASEMERLPPKIPDSQDSVCGECKFTSSSLPDFCYHVHSCPKKSDLYNCIFCPESVPENVRTMSFSMDNILRHLKLHGPKLFKCPYCEDLSNLKKRIEKHVYTEHAGKKLFVKIIRDDGSQKVYCCLHCTSKVTTSDDMLQHLKNTHDIDGKYKCHMCSFAIKSPSDIKQHSNDSHAREKVKCIPTYYTTLSFQPTQKQKPLVKPTLLTSKVRPRTVRNMPTAPVDFGKPTKNSFKCTVRSYCSFETTDVHKFRIHLKSELSELKWMCVNCDKALTENEVSAHEGHNFNLYDHVNDRLIVRKTIASQRNRADKCR